MRSIRYGHFVMFCRITVLLPILLSFSAVSLSSRLVLADESPDEDVVRRKTAVALNYCRAALHRIRRSPEKHVFVEEQQRILNNLDLNQIEDPEVISLYKSILDEISQVEISDRERHTIDEQFRRSIHRKLGTDFFVIGAQVATGQLGSVIQTGANSWWDYRTQEARRDSDQWKVEKTQFSSLMTRSSGFLDSFWKLSRKNNIPDRWLIRDYDLDQLNRVLVENDPERRLRMLSRMERFMECYPPYWYYVARTQQQLGLNDEALGTYRKLKHIGAGHFRQDDMLAGSLSNMALLLEFRNDPEAAQIAESVIDYSTRNWEANLICAWVLGRHQKFSSAEELILCNLDDQLETSQSNVALVSLYFHSEDRPKLAKLLENSDVVRQVPIPGLLLCARLLGTDELPKTAQTYLASTLSASFRRSVRGDSLILAASSGWKIYDASPEILSGTQTLKAVGYRPVPMGVYADFPVAHADGADPQEVQSLKLRLNYPGTPEIRVTMRLEADGDNRSGNLIAAGPFRVATELSAFGKKQIVYSIGEIELEGVRISFHELPRSAAADADPEISIEEQKVRS